MTPFDLQKQHLLDIYNNIKNKVNPTKDEIQNFINAIDDFINASKSQFLTSDQQKTINALQIIKNLLISQQPKTESKELSTGAKVGITFGILGIVGLGAFLIYQGRKRR